MKIRVKIFCEEENTEKLIKHFQPNCFNIRRIKGGIIIDPLLENKRYMLPNDIKMFEFIPLISISEFGGKGKPTQIICGLSGKPLKPYYIPKTNVKPNGEHAFFSIRESCVCINVDLNKNITIMRLKISLDDNDLSCFIFKDILYTGTQQDIPPEITNTFSKAIQTAIKKSNTQDCVNNCFTFET